VQVALEPGTPSDPVTLVLGDWVSSHWAAVARVFVGRDDADMGHLLADAGAPAAMDTHEKVMAFVKAATQQREAEARQREDRAKWVAEKLWTDEGDE
jgi:hypothetical protein